MEKWTEQAILNDLINTKESNRITENAKDDLILLHHSLGRFIRNKYRLWEHDWAPQIVDGVDISENHPDAVSQRIIIKLYEYWMNKTEQQA